MAMASSTIQRRPSMRPTLLGIAGGLIATYLAIRFLWPAVLSLVVGGATYYLLGPIVSWLKRRHVPRTLSTLVLASGILVGVAFAGAKLLPRLYTEMQEFVSGLPEQVAVAERWLIAQGVLGEDADPRVRSAATSILDRSDDMVAGALTQGIGAVRGAFGSLTSILFGLIFGIYLLTGGAELARRLPAWIPLDRRDRWARFGARASRVIAGYVRARVLASLFIGVSYWAAFSLIGIRNAALLAAIGGLLNFVPVIGPLLAAVPAVIVAAFQGWTKVLAVIAVQLGAQQIESSIIEPLIEGRFVRLPPIAVLLAVVVGSALAGIPGMLLAVPVAAVTRVALEIFFRETWSPGAAPGGRS